MTGIQIARFTGCPVSRFMVRRIAASPYAGDKGYGFPRFHQAAVRQFNMNSLA
jgi:hypothetical protein